MSDDKDGGGSEERSPDKPPPPPNIPVADGATEAGPADDDGRISDQALVDRIKASDRWMIGLTAALVLAALLQWCELHSSGVDTKKLADATVSLAGSTDRLVQAAQAQASAAEKLRLAGEAQATSMDKLKRAGEAQAKAAQDLALAGRSQAQFTGNLARSGQAANRAWLYPALVKAVQTPGNSDYTMYVSVVNTGHSPALRVEGSVFVETVSPRLIASGQKMAQWGASPCARTDPYRNTALTIYPNSNSGEQYVRHFTYPTNTDVIFVQGCFTYRTEHYAGVSEFCEFGIPYDGTKLIPPTEFLWRSCNNHNEAR